MSMPWISEYFYRPMPLLCPVCGNTVTLENLSYFMGITGVEGCEWTVYRYDFINDMHVECTKCHSRFKVCGSIFDGPDEGYLRSDLMLKPLSN